MNSDYGGALKAAVEAAQAAGQLLREEFHRPGGPRGTPGKAPADQEAETVIRRLLLSAFPRWSYLGEETGRHTNGAGDPHCWLVDPNDGTAVFQKGHRGSAVSIALLRDGRPVLGVVYAFAAPDDSGDLFAWAEGCGPMQRNGRPVQRAPWPAQLGPHDVILLAPGAQWRPAANLAVLAPARFRALPSIAYRLALAAAGDGAAAVSVHSPGSWDYGGGHALLLATGGELVNEHGERVTYSAGGESSTQRCFGGAPRLLIELAHRHWPSVLGPREPDSGEPASGEPDSGNDLVTLAPGANVSDAGTLSRAQGCLLGQLAGDSLGSLVEFQPAARIAEQYSSGLRELADGGHWGTIAGQPTDDSEMALALARSIVRAGGYNPEAAATAYAFWYGSHPFDCGNTVYRALLGIGKKELSAGKAAETARKSANPESQANGSLMRASPLGIWGAHLPPAELAEHAHEDARLTHPSRVCQEAGALFTIAVAHAIHSGADAHEVYSRALSWAKAHTREKTLRQVLADAAVRPPADFSRLQGWVLIALQNAFYQFLHAPSLEEGVVRTVMAGGDTDTNAAIAGALLGALHGRDAVPFQWRQMLLSCRPLERLKGVRHPRPRAFWPVDAMELAERLLLARPE